jgi:FkbM family methyltransferase
MKILRDAEITKFVCSLFPPGECGYALELGASDGLYLSNTHELEQAGWEVLCVEPNKDYYQKLAKNRKRTLNVACASSNKDAQELVVYTRHLPIEWHEPVSSLGPLGARFKVNFCPDAREAERQTVDVRTLDWCLETTGFPRLDYLSLDVDGLEMDILRGLDPVRWNLKVAAVENPFANQAIHTYFKEAGFNLVARTHVNDIWSRL